VKASDNEFPKLLLVVDTDPDTPDSGLAVVYAKTGGGLFYKDDAGTEHQLLEAGGAVDWGDIGGTLADQADLQAALDAKLDADDYVIPLGIACSDESTALTTGTAKATFRAPFACTVTGVRGTLTTAQTSGSIFTVDINESGTTILSTKLTIDNTEKTSTTAAIAAVISDSSIADDAEITVDIDQVGDGTAKGLKVWLLVKPS
jgi:hypothetical protein